MKIFKISKFVFPIIAIFIICFAFSCESDENDPVTEQGDTEIESSSGQFMAIDFEIVGSELVVLFSDYTHNFNKGIGRFEKKNDTWELVHWISADSIKDGLDFPHTLNVTQNGYLISDSMSDRAIEVDNAGQILFEHSAPYTNEAISTSQGIVITSSDLISFENCRIQIVNTENEVIWEFYPILDYPNAIPQLQIHHGNLLPNGNVLMAISPSMGAAGGNGIILEVNNEKEVVWEFIHEYLSWPRNALRLKNGNSLIAHFDGLWEVDSEGSIVWEFEKPNDTLDGPEGGAMFNIARLDNGTTVAVLNGDIVWIAPDGTITEQFSYGENKSAITRKMRESFGALPYL